jgi:hypothetical protein
MSYSVVYCTPLGCISDEENAACIGADRVVMASGRHSHEVSGIRSDAGAIHNTAFEHIALLCLAMIVGRVFRAWLHSDQNRLVSKQRPNFDTRKWQGPPGSLVAANQQYVFCAIRFLDRRSNAPQ